MGKKELLVGLKSLHEKSPLVMSTFLVLDTDETETKSVISEKAEQERSILEQSLERTKVRTGLI